MAVSRTQTYAPNYMHPWNQWFLERQKRCGTVEAFAHASGLSIHTVSGYRNHKIPKRAESLRKIAAMFDGDIGPLPGSPSGMDLEERVRRLEIAAIAMKADTADILRRLLDTLNDANASDQDRARAQEDLNEQIRLMEPAPDDLRRLIDDAQRRAAEASDESDDEQPEDDAPPGRSP